ncbi:methylated-DNA--[protein]-cysteine S-methyltransferase [Mycetocola reblochoni]|nr:methylated-DNA--[protein]-cysteine S-methyltransferase [Mycetocola reblochoni]
MLDTPLGGVLVAATERGLVRVAFDTEGTEQVLETLAARIGARILFAPGSFEETSRQLDQYFTGRRREFSLGLDRRLSTGFRRTVQVALPELPYGTTVSYGRLAATVGNPRAVRAVGTACATNPLPIVVPCHRVIRSDGRLGGYVGGEQAKSRLIELERSFA